MVSLRHRNDVGVFKHHCGATLISRSWVVTAAHCFDVSKDNLYWRVRLGTDISSSWEFSRHRDSDVVLVILHPGFNVSRHGNDIALVRLATPADWNEATPICLPEKENMGVIRPGRDCFVTGWGDTRGTGDKSVLKEVGLPVIDRDLCSTWYNETIPDDAFCAGYSFGGRDSCKGDSGGPYACPRDGAWTLVGVVSWGKDCAEGHQPGVYTSVAYHLQWIKDSIMLYDAMLGDLRG